MESPRSWMVYGHVGEQPCWTEYNVRLVLHRWMVVRCSLLWYSMMDQCWPEGMPATVSNWERLARLEIDNDRSREDSQQSLVDVQSLSLSVPEEHMFVLAQPVCLD